MHNEQIQGQLGKSKLQLPNLNATTAPNPEDNCHQTYQGNHSFRKCTLRRINNYFRMPQPISAAGDNSCRGTKKMSVQPQTARKTSCQTPKPNISKCIPSRESQTQHITLTYRTLTGGNPFQ